MPTARMVLFWARCIQTSINHRSVTKKYPGTRFADGAEYSYNRKTHTLTIRGGIEHIVIECGADVVLKNTESHD